MNDDHGRIAACAGVRAMGSARPYRRKFVCAALVLFGLVNAPATGHSQTLPDSQTTPGGSVHALAARLALVLSKDVGDMFGGNKRGVDNSTAGGADSVMRAHLAKYMPRDTVIALTIRAYEQGYSEQELRSALGYFESPMGREYLSKQRVVGLAMRRMVDSIMAAHQTELQQALIDLARRRMLAPPTPEDQMR